MSKSIKECGKEENIILHQRECFRFQFQTFILQYRVAPERESTKSQALERSINYTPSPLEPSEPFQQIFFLAQMLPWLTKEELGSSSKTKGLIVARRELVISSSFSIINCISGFLFSKLEAIYTY